MIDVIVPVYRGAADVRRCLGALQAAACRTPAEIVVIDDCSPDPQLSSWLDAQADAGRITLLRNPRNRGFVGSVNRGMALHPERDVVLLNSDTEVANDWLDRLVACAASTPDVATVTPFSNNATICSYPFDGWTGEVPGTLGLAGLDRLFARVHAGVAVELPTAVGFCMLIRRAALDRLGLFDEARFGRGYGEENDFSLRAAKAGWRNLLCADTYVYHRGGVSFGPGRVELMQRAERALLEVHPDYNERVAAFVAADPLRPLCEAIDEARRASGAREAAALASEHAGLGDGKVRFVGWAGANDVPEPERPHDRYRRPAVLHLSHSWGGGVDRWVRDFANADEQGWNLVLRSRTWRNEAGVRLELLDVLAGDEPLLAWDLEQPIDTTAIAHEAYRRIVTGIVAEFGVEAVIVSSLIGHSLDAFDTGRPTVVVLHDFYPFCPALFAWFGGECRRCERTDLQRCLESNPLNVFWHHDHAPDWLALREAYAARLARDDVWVAAPSRAVRERYAALFPVLRDKPWALIPHGLGVVPARAAAPDFATLADAGRRLRVLVPGRLLLHKGLHLVEEALPALAGFADVLLLGCGDFGRPFAELEHVLVVPDYPNAELAAHVAEFRPDCALLLSVLPETFSYTLSEMQALGVPPVATALGAFAERIDDGVNGFLVEPDSAAIVERLRGLAADPSALERVAETLRASPVRIAARMVADYRALFAPGGAAPAAAEMLAALVEAVERGRAREHWLQDERTRIARVGERAAAVAAAESAARIAGLHAELDALRGALGQVQSELAASRAETARLASGLAAAEAYRDALLGSTSWRLTRPLRAVREAIAGGADADLPPAPIEPPPLVAPVVAVPAAPRAEPAAIRLVAYRDGDPIARRRAVSLASRLGVGAVVLPPASPDPGATLAVGRSPGDAPDPVGSFVPDVTCVEHPADSSAGTTAPRVVVPTQRLADVLAAAGQCVAARPEVVPFPLVGEPLHETRRAAERLRRRDALGIPDSMRIVVGVGRADAQSGLLRFARIAMEVAGRNNGCCFVWVGGADADWMREHSAEIGIVAALRRLFLVADAFEPWLMAADAYLGCRADGVYDAGALEALAAGLPVAVECAGSLADGLREPGLAERIDLAVGDNALPALASWTRAPLAPRRDAARLVREVFGGDDAVAAFDAAFGGGAGSAHAGLPVALDDSKGAR